MTKKLNDEIECGRKTKRIAAFGIMMSAVAMVLNIVCCVTRVGVNNEAALLWALLAMATLTALFYHVLPFWKGSKKKAGKHDGKFEENET